MLGIFENINPDISKATQNIMFCIFQKLISQACKLLILVHYRPVRQKIHEESEIKF